MGREIFLTSHDGMKAAESNLFSLLYFAGAWTGSDIFFQDISFFRGNALVLQAVLDHIGIDEFAFD